MYSAIVCCSSFGILPYLLGELMKLNSRALSKLTVQIMSPHVVIEKRREVYLSSKHIYKYLLQYTLFSTVFNTEVASIFNTVQMVD